MIPQSIISIKLAEKILFIGKVLFLIFLIFSSLNLFKKANKILQTNKKFENKEISSLPDPKIINILKEIEEYDSFKFNVKGINLDKFIYFCLEYDRKIAIRNRSRIIGAFNQKRGFFDSFNKFEDLLFP